MPISKKRPLGPENTFWAIAIMAISLLIVLLGDTRETRLAHARVTEPVGVTESINHRGAAWKEKTADITNEVLQAAAPLKAGLPGACHGRPMA